MEIIKNDKDYRNAINCEHTGYYNYPCTFNNEGKKYILGIGSADSTQIYKKDNCYYVVAKNYGLDYISMTYIDPKYDIVKECFLQGEDINNPDNYSYNIFDKDIEDQIKILSEYIEF